MQVKTLILGMLHTNCYFLYDEKTKESAVIDPACNFETIRDFIDQNQLKIQYIILTHAHYDHIGALDELKQYTDAPICISKIENEALNDSQLNLCAHFRSACPISHANKLMKDSDTLLLAGKELKFILTPGHTAGSMSVLCENLLFSGDTLFFESLGRTDFPRGSMTDIMDSIKNKLFTLPQNTVVYPGHGEQTTIDHEIDNNPYVW